MASSGEIRQRPSPPPPTPVGSPQRQQSDFLSGDMDSSPQSADHEDKIQKYWISEVNARFRQTSPFYPFAKSLVSRVLQATNFTSDYFASVSLHAALASLHTAQAHSEAACMMGSG
jgi:hypothetical protein